MSDDELAGGDRGSPEARVLLAASILETPLAEPRPLAGGAVMSAMSRVGVAVAGALTSIVIARQLGPDGAGAYFVAQSLILLLAVAATLGVEHGVLYYVSSGRWDARSAYATALKLAVVTGCIGAFAGLGLRLLVPSAFAGLPVWLVAVVAAGLPFVLMWFYATFVALAIDRYEAYVLPPFWQATAVLILSVPGAMLYGLDGAVVGMTASSVLVGIGCAAWARRWLPKADAIVGRRHIQLRRAVSFGIKGYAANALQLLSYRLDLFVLAAAASTATVGLYSVAVAVTSVLWLLPGALSDVLFPRVAQLSASDEEGHREYVEIKSLRHIGLIVGVTAFGIAIALEVLVVPIYGAEFGGAVDLGLILLPGVALLGIAGVLASTIVGRGKPAYSLYVALVTTPIAIALYATLIPRFEATGAALASTLSYSASFVLYCWFYRRVTGRKVLPLLVPTRSEFDDLRALPGAIWARAGRSRR